MSETYPGDPYATNKRYEMQCRGVTQTGSACRLRAIGSDCYCSRHVLSTAPTVPAAVGWPSSKMLVRWLPTRPAEWIGTHGVVEALRTDQFLMLTLVLLQYRNLADESQVLIDRCLERMSGVPHLAAYREYFGRELSHSYRDAARKRLVSFYFKRCEDLCDDVVGKILESV